MTDSPGSLPVPALMPRPASDSRGHQFVVYGDSCSGIPNAIHEATTAAVNAVVARLDPAPEFICFLGDEVIGLTSNEAALRAQWRHWFEVEMAWLDRSAIPLYHTTANHTTYDAMSERVFADVMAHLPANGPAEQRHLSYTIRRDDLVMIFVNTMWSGLGEGRVETAWLEEQLRDHGDARYKLVFGHHPVFPVNGFGGDFQREIEHGNGRRFWDILVRHGVFAYWCSHMLAFDAQVHDGVLQILTAGAGTKHRLPEGIEYLHAMQAALDPDGMRYQVLDDTGTVREHLAWPPRLAPSLTWEELTPASATGMRLDPLQVWEIGGTLPEAGGAAQTLLSFWNEDDWLPPLWIGLTGPEMRVGVLLAPQVGRSPHFWHGPALVSGAPFRIQIGLHRDLGPGGMLWRWNDDSPWHSMTGVSAWGIERIPATHRVSIGHSKGDANDRPFRGRDLRVTMSRRSNPTDSVRGEPQHRCESESTKAARDRVELRQLADGARPFTRDSEG